MRKYEPLTRYLEKQSDLQLTLSFEEIAGIINNKLPKSALYGNLFWWSNPVLFEGTVQARAWKAGGYKVESVKFCKSPNERRGKVVFERLPAS